MESGEFVKKKRWPRAVLIAAALLVAAYLLYPKGGTQSLYDKETVRIGTVERQLGFEGTVTAPRSQSFAAEQAAVVQAVYVAQGDEIAKGDRLLKLSTGELIRSDIAGQVANLLVAEDDAVAAGQRLADVVDFDRLEIEIKVDEFDVLAVVPGGAVSVTIDALSKAVEGKILRIDPLATKGNDISYYMATLSFPADVQVLPGMRVGAKVLSERAEDVPILSVAALNFDDYNSPYVLLSGAEGPREVPVTVGVSDGTVCQITSGLQAGDEVLYTKQPSALMFPGAMAGNGA
jgi:multidrug efflux pump subunit AcrA (membrane-fusion protein)